MIREQNLNSSPFYGIFRIPPVAEICQFATSELARKMRTLAEKVRNQNQRIDNLLRKVEGLRRNFS